MECRSERFKIVKRTPSHLSSNSNLNVNTNSSRKGGTQYYAANKHKQAYHHQPRKRQKAGLFFCLQHLAKLLYACVLTCYGKLLQCCRFLIRICQQNELPLPAQTQTSTSSESDERPSTAPESSWNWSWRNIWNLFASTVESNWRSLWNIFGSRGFNREHVPEFSSSFSRASPAVLFSSDSESEGEGEEELEWRNLRQEESLVDNSEDDDDDDDLPFFRFASSAAHYVNLYRFNYPQFRKELLGTFYGWWFSPRYPGGYSNLKSTKSHPDLLRKRAATLKRRRSELKRNKMSRATGDSHKGWILRVAFASRLLVFLIQIICNNLLNSVKHNNDGFKFIPEKSYGKILDPLVNAVLGGYINWDANCFLHITVYGYTSENMLAFFPLLPMTLYVPSRIAYVFLGFFVSLSSIVVIVGVVLNTWLFLKCTENIYELATLWSGGSKQFVTTACVMFSFNPASIFFSGLYTETLFAYLTSKVILSLFERNYWTSLVCCAMSGLCRSNGFLNVGFILALMLQRELLKKNMESGLFSFFIRSLLTGIAGFAPFGLFQMYSYNRVCEQGIIYDPASIPLYCDGLSLSLPYSYIQKKYWNVGFLEYFQIKQIPNFILAFPVLYVLGSESWSSMRILILQIQRERTINGIYYAAQALHGMFLTAFCFLFCHVQVSTRMIMSACPYLYTFVADSHLYELEKFRNREIAVPRLSLGITLWCCLYFVIGSAAFSLGLPWT